MKILFYNETLLNGGIEKCLENFVSVFYKKYDIEIVYINNQKLDNRIVENLQKHAKVHKLEVNEIIETDICIWCRLYMDYDKLQKQIKAKKQYLWVHSKPRERENCILDNKKFIKNIELIICVSKTIQNMLNINKRSIVIHNFMPKYIKNLSLQEIKEDIFEDENRLKLVTVSRLSKRKRI